MKKVVVLGATGSIGKSSLEIMSTLPDLFRVVGLVANKNAESLIALSKKYHCNKLCLCGAENPAFDEILYTGTDGIKRLLDDTKPDIVINGIAGSAGLLPSVFVLERGIDLALANKETVVMAYPLVRTLAEKNNCRILPVDSEHSAVFSLINHFGRENVA